MRRIFDLSFLPVEVVEDIVESVHENVEDRDIIDVNIEYIATPINSHLTADPNLPESSNMEDNIALIKAELLSLESFVTEAEVLQSSSP